MAKRDYEVGYRKPPKHTRFQPGQSGNPRGRPKGVQNLATDLQEELAQKIVVTEANQTLEVTKQRAMLKTMFAKALKGDSRAAQVLIQLILGLERARNASTEQKLLDEDDAAVLESLCSQLLDETTGESTPDMEQDDA